MKFELPKLPFGKTALQPHMSEETLNYHYSKHHATYVDKLNGLTEGTDYQGMALEAVIRASSGPLFNNAAQVWNHTFFWHCLSPEGGGEPQGKLKRAIEARWQNFEAFRQAFSSEAANNFGSGWTWLVVDENGDLDILNTANADTPITRAGIKPLLTVDVWEHAYYIDHRNSRPDYLQAFWQIANWSFAEANYEFSEPERDFYPFSTAASVA